MKVTVVCVNAEKRVRREPNGKRAGFISRGQFEALPVDEAPENKEFWASTPQLSLDIPGCTQEFEPNAKYTIEIKPAK